MCGRFENKVREDWMMEKFAEFDISVFFKTSTNERKFENIVPTNSIVTIMHDDNNLSADMNKWGIKFAAKSPLIFNSRIETIYLSTDSERNFEKCLPYKDSGNMEMELAGI